MKRPGPCFSAGLKIPEPIWIRRPRLRNLHLMGEDGRMTHAGAWLLARDIRKFNISADVACALFMGTDKVRILDRRDFHGDVYSMIEEVMAWILSKINVEYIIKHVRREERPELPEEAIREAVVNASGPSRLPLDGQCTDLSVQRTGSKSSARAGCPPA